MSIFDDDTNYAITGDALNRIWRHVYLPLIEDDGTPERAIKGDRRRDMAQFLGAVLEQNTFEIPDDGVIP